MDAKSISQMLLFFAVTFYLIWKGYLLTEYMILGVFFGVILHWSITNKGNKNIINIRPLSSGFRVLFYDIYLGTLLIRGLLEGFSHEILFWIVALVLLIAIDYFVEG